MSDAAGQRRPMVIGLVGGIASGKSAVADAFERLGCVVSRSDREAHALLLDDEIRDTIAEWFGQGVLDESGGVDRAALARVVFGDDAARARLEGLLHPRLHAQRQGLIERAAGEGASMVVVDAPLLFEARVDRECDAVVFVDAPLERRLARARAHRGWDKLELEKRENAQMGLDAKRAKADYVVQNDGDLPELDRRVASLFRALLASADESDRA